MTRITNRPTAKARTTRMIRVVIDIDHLPAGKPPFAERREATGPSCKFSVTGSTQKSGAGHHENR
jgi:hypothetical protein